MPTNAGVMSLDAPGEVRRFWWEMGIVAAALPLWWTFARVEHLVTVASLPGATSALLLGLRVLGVLVALLALVAAREGAPSPLRTLMVWRIWLAPLLWLTVVDASTWALGTRDGIEMAAAVTVLVWLEAPLLRR